MMTWGEYMEFSMTKRMDNLGRIVIPKELRRYYGFEPDDELVLIPMQKGVLLTKETKKEKCD